MKIFSKEKYVKNINPEYIELDEKIEEKMGIIPWWKICDGKEVIDGRCEAEGLEFLVSDRWIKEDTEEQTESFKINEVKTIDDKKEREKLTKEAFLENIENLKKFIKNKEGIEAGILVCLADEDNCISITSNISGAMVSLCMLFERLSNQFGIEFIRDSVKCFEKCYKKKKGKL